MPTYVYDRQPHWDIFRRILHIARRTRQLQRSLKKQEEEKQE